jgi:hypothetical protein
MTKKDNYEFLKSKYGNVASWTIWDKAPDGSETKNLNVGGSEWCSDENALIRRIHEKYVFVAANPFSEKTKDKETAPDKVEKHKSKLPWMSNFHSSRRNAHDHKLRYATAGTEMEGCYITDLIKDVESSNVNSFIEDKKKNGESVASIIARNIAVFKEEISHFSKKPIIIALGKFAYEMLMKQHLDKEYKVVPMSHYSSTIQLFTKKGLTFDLYKKEAQDIINSCK